MKRTFLLLLSALLPLLASAYDAQIDGIYYNFSGDEATVTYRDYAFNSYSGNVVIPKSVTFNDKTYSVTSISVQAFWVCSGLTSITIPNSVTSIGDYAFHGCSGLTSVTIPNSVTSIGNYAFQGCSSLTSIILQEGMTNISEKAFYNCNGLTSITIPNSVTSISDDAFCFCTSLTSITIPNSVTIIGNYAFAGCSGLTSITIPNSVTSIGESAFESCSGLTSFTFPNSVTTIGDGLLFECSGLTSITIPNNVTSIGRSAFYGCSSLTSVTISNSVTTIGDAAFYDCSSLTSITIPNSVTTIDEATFYGCSSLASVSIGNSVTSIGKEAFIDCKLRNLLIHCATPPSASTSAFSEQTLYHTTLYIPIGSWDAYAYDNAWYKFINIRETATTEQQVSMQQAYTLMDASTFAYSVYDPVNDRIGTINSAGGINEDNPNHSWQVIEADGWHYLYNIGARKYVRREGDRLELTDTPEPIELADSDNGLILGGQTEKPCVLVSNERMSVAQSAIDVVTGIKNLNNSPMANGQPFFNLAGQRIKTPQHGINIIGNRKVLVK